jgi:hypothetical protein
MPVDSDASIVAEHARTVLSLEAATLSDEYRYQSLPLCVIDAVFSISARYASTRQVVVRYCEYTSQRRIRSSAELPPIEQQESITSFCTRREQADVGRMAELVYQNRQRTSTRSGILKSEAVLLFAQALRSFGVEHLQDVPHVAESEAFKTAITSIPGQRSGISLQYFWMLAGSEEFVKPDRMVVRFLESALDRPVRTAEAASLLREASNQLNTEFPNMNPRLLDHEVWKYQRLRAAA